MAAMKIKGPDKLHPEFLSDTKFEIWKDKLECFLATNAEFRQFLPPKGKYQTWTAAEKNPDRIPDRPESDTDTSDIEEIRRSLKTMLTVIADFIHEDSYNPISRQSTSLQWIYNKIQRDYNIQKQGIHFLQIIDLKYDPTEGQTPVGFYNAYRSMVMANLKPKGTKIEWLNETLDNDEQLTSSHEDLIFLNVMTLLHPKLPAYVREHYSDKIGENKTIMDFRTEILSKAKTYIEEIQNPVAAASIAAAPPPTADYTHPEHDEPDCNYIQTSRFSNPYQQRVRPSFRQRQPFTRPSTSQRPTYQRQFHQQSYNQLPPFCKLCFVSNKPRHIWTGHYIGQRQCPSLSNKDKDMLEKRMSQQFGQQLNAITMEENDESLFESYDYTTNETEEYVDNQVNFNTTANIEASCNFIQPVPSQILTVKDVNNKNIHLDLDSGANVSFCRLSAVLDHGFKIHPNGQLSRLGDGKTKLPALGEIMETFTRNDFEVKYHAIVTKELHCDWIAGTNFIKQNSVMQDFNSKTIIIHKKYVVPETSRSLILPTQANNIVAQNNKISVLFPGASIDYQVPHSDLTKLAVQPWFQNKQQWPEPQICTVSNGKITIVNNSTEPVNMQKNNKLQIRTINTDITQDHRYTFPNQNFYDKPLSIDKTKEIEINTEGVSTQVL